MENLRPYEEKRNFTRTPEPPARMGPPERMGLPERAESSGGGLRFVVQRHAASRDHYDFRLEWGGSLLSWAVPKGPSYNTRDKRLAVHVENHPLEYRNFEGTIPKGEYGGGTVMLWDEGSWEPQLGVDEGLRDGSLKFVLRGERLKGKWALVRMKTKDARSQDNWLLLKERDEFAKAEEGISGYTTSVRTGRTMAGIEGGERGAPAGKRERKSVEAGAKNPFDRAKVQLAKPESRVPAQGDWLYEVKYDGYRILAFLEGGDVRLVTRNGLDYTEHFRPVSEALRGWAGERAMVLDGEMAVSDKEGRTDFQALQNYLKSPGGKALTYIVFDLLALDGTDLRELPLLKRKETLEKLLKNAHGSLQYSPHVRGQGEESFRAAKEKGLEGIIGKRADSAYSGSRNGDWIKLKCDARQEFVIGGYTRTEKKTEGVSSLLLGVYEGGDFVYCGRAGTGLSRRSMLELEARMKPLGRKTPPFRDPPKPRSNEEIFWLRPALSAEIKFAEWTDEGLLRQASFKGLRADKDPKEIRREQARADAPEAAEPPSAANLPAANPPEGNPSEGNPPEGKTGGTRRTRTVKSPAAEPPSAAGPPAAKTTGPQEVEGVAISSPDKVLFADAGVTKMDMVRYYQAVAPRMLPYAADRLLSIVRCPQGISGACFFRKHPDAGHPGLAAVSVPDSGGEPRDYYYIRDISGLIYEVQMNTLEFHVWGSRADRLEQPDMMVFDLDPDVGMPPDEIRRGVRDLKRVLDGLSLTSYLKTSGGKGYHVVVPFQPAPDWETFHAFARNVAGAMAQKWPERYTDNVRKEARKGKIFIDWIRNGRGATSVAPYSVRARKGAAVSMPIAWRELNAVAPDGITMRDALARLRRSDPWEGFFDTGQRLK